MHSLRRLQSYGKANVQKKYELPLEEIYGVLIVKLMKTVNFHDTQVDKVHFALDPKPLSV